MDSEVREFLQEVADWLKDGECFVHGSLCNGEKANCRIFALTLEDAVETLGYTITRAREIVDRRVW